MAGSARATERDQLDDARRLADQSHELRTEHLPAGDVAIKHVSDLYLYPNTVRAVKITGAQLKGWLERSAGMFNQVTMDGGDEQLLQLGHFLLPAPVAEMDRRVADDTEHGAVGAEDQLIHLVQLARGVECQQGRAFVAVMDDFQRRQIEYEVRAGMEQGAVGLSTGLDYIVQCFSTTEEVAAACAAMADRGGRF